MMNRKQLSVNAVAAAIQVVVTGIVYLILYRFLLDRLGENEFGIWALVLALSSVSNVANLGLASACIPFVAQTIAEGDRLAAASIVRTAASGVAAFLLVILLVSYPIIRAILPLLADSPEAVQAGIAILPVALGSLWCASVSSVFLSSLEGCQRMDVKSYLLMATVVVYAAGAIALAPSMGLRGVAGAHIAHTALLLVASWLFLRREIRELGLLPFGWGKAAFRRIYRYGAAMQLISIAQILTEPAAKSLVSYFGGLGALSMYEFASKMAYQLRGVVATAHRAVVPAVAGLRMAGEDHVKRLFVRSHRLLQLFVSVSLPILLVLLPTISVVWVGRYEPFFVVSASILLPAWFFNLLANPGYYGFLGEGAARWPTISHVVIGLGNAVLGLVLGTILGAPGVVAGYGVALVAASFLVSRAYRNRYDIPMSEITSAYTWVFALTCICAAFVTFLLVTNVPGLRQPVAVLLTAPFLYVVMLSYPALKNQTAVDALTWLKAARAHRSQ